jgi:membrane protease YdiL (CAAX protease family)
MTAIKAFIKKHPVLTYFALVFAISWGGVIIVLGPGGFTSTPEQLDVLLPFVVLAILAGPSVAGVLMTGLIDGRTGLLELRSRLLRWRVSARWYAVALLTAPLIVMATLLPLSLISPVFLPGIFAASDKVSLLLSGIAAGLAGGFLEELGWTGFAVPRMKLRYGLFTTGLIVGLIWGAWHSPTAFWGSSDSAGAVSLAIYVPVALFSFLPPYRVLMVWVYDRTESLLIAMLMHASLIPSIFYVLTPPATGWAFVTYHLMLAAALWVVVAAVAVANDGHLSRPGKPPAGIGSPQLTPR